MHTELAEHNVLIINKRAIMQLALELEGRDVLQSLLLVHCLDQLDDIDRKLSMLSRANQRDVFLALPMDGEEWQRFLRCHSLPQSGKV